jgi:hypothetical protein
MGRVRRGLFGRAAVVERMGSGEGGGWGVASGCS